MNLNPRIIEALSTVDLYAFPDYYDSKSTQYDADGAVIPEQTEWITFNYVSEAPTIYADDVDLFESATVDVHFFTPNGGNVQSYKKQIKNALRSADFVIESTELFYENDSGMWHGIVTISDENEMEV